MNVITDNERREVARRLREKKAECEKRGYPWMCDDLILALGYDHDYEAGDEIFDRLADLIEPEPERTWHDFSDELPPVGVSVLCRGKNGALYVGKPVTFKGNVTRKVWVPRGDQYRTPEKWMDVSA